MQITAKVKEILNLEKGLSKAGKEWSKRTLVVDTGDQYNPTLAIDFSKPDLLNGLKQGQDVTIDFNLSSNEWNGKYFTKVNGYKIS